MLPELWQLRFRRLLYLGCASLFGFLIALPPLFVGRLPSIPLLIVGILVALPGLIYATVVTLWHWKSRYRGTHSDLWGGLMLLEASGWFRLLYLFRHIIPDARGTGRYFR